MKFNIITLFPDFFKGTLEQGLVGQAFSKGLVSAQFLNPRDSTTDVHHTVDDRPYGGGDGMVLKADVMRATLETLGAAKGDVIYLTPQGRLWGSDQAREWAREWARSKRSKTLICGRYAGLDQRFISAHVDEEISVGDYVLSGGEVAAMVIIDSVSRFLPEVLGNQVSAQEDSFEDGLLEGPCFTRPGEFEGFEVPEVLRSGQHKKIEHLRLALRRIYTFLRRPDLFEVALKKKDLSSWEDSCELLASLPLEEQEVFGFRGEDVVSLRQRLKQLLQIQH